MTVLKQLDALIEAGNVSGVFIGRSAVPGSSRFCTIQGNDGHSRGHEGSGRGNTSEEAVANALAQLNAPRRRMPGVA